MSSTARSDRQGHSGNNIGRTVNYLFGPGKHNEHTNPHLIAAWDNAWLTDAALVASLTTAKGRRRLIAELHAPRILHQVEVSGGHVYHVPLSPPPRTDWPRAPATGAWISPGTQSRPGAFLVNPPPRSIIDRWIRGPGRLNRPRHRIRRVYRALLMRTSGR
ncbi:MAG: hypothetical protein ACJ72N_02260 [Labedaea sp.]